MKLRSNWLRVFLVACMTLIVARLFSIQVIHYDEYVAKAETQHTMQNTIVAKRGEIYILDGDNNPVPIVMNTKVWAIIIDPQITRENRSELEKVINENAKDYLVSNFDDAFKSTFSIYHVIAKNVPFKQAQAIKEAKLAGVYFSTACHYHLHLVPF